MNRQWAAKGTCTQWTPPPPQTCNCHSFLWSKGSTLSTLIRHPPVPSHPPSRLLQVPEIVPDRVVVKYILPSGGKTAAQGVGTQAATSAAADAAASALQGLGLATLPGAGSSSSTTARTRGSTGKASAAASGEVAVVGVYAITDGSSVAGKVAQLQQLPGGWCGARLVRCLPLPASSSIRRSHCPPTCAAAAVEYAEPLYVYRAQQGSRLPNDPQLSSLWWVSAIRADAAWATATGSRAVQVCVVDTGVEKGHEDLGNGGWL